MGVQTAEKPQTAAYEFPQTRPPYDPEPELAARVRELGLEQNIRDLQEVGFTVVTGIEEDLTARLRAAILASPSKAADNVLGEDPVWTEAITHPKLLTLAEAAVGGGFLVSMIVGGIKPKGGHTFGLHCDQNWTPAPFPQHTQMMTFCWVTDDAYEDASGGPTLVIPGSHKHMRHPNKAEMEAREGAIPIKASRSSVAVWRGETWHGSYPRSVEGERVTAHIVYSRLACRQIDDFSAFANEEWLEGKPEIMRTLLGMTDALGQRNATRNPRLQSMYRTARR